MATATTQTHLIKKYANRKLYDTRTSRYITLEGISELLRRGHDVKVVDRESGRDITSLILSQIVMSEEKRGEDRNHSEGDAPDRGQALLGYVREALNLPAMLVGNEVERRRGEFESVIDAAIERALSRLSIPSSREVERLSTRVEQLARRLDRMDANRVRAKGTSTRKGAA